jgi:hypothetical protein
VNCRAGCIPQVRTLAETTTENRDSVFSYTVAGSQRILIDFVSSRETAMTTHKLLGNRSTVYSLLIAGIADSLRPDGELSVRFGQGGLVKDGPKWLH